MYILKAAILVLAYSVRVMAFDATFNNISVISWLLYIFDACMSVDEMYGQNSIHINKQD